MSASPKALIAWSSGKDSAWALHEARVAGDFEIVGALTTVTDTFHRVSMHGVREELLRAQFDAAGLRPVIIRIPYPCPNDIYERKMAEAIAAARASGVTHMIFGDLFLEDVRAYRERQLSGNSLPNDEITRLNEQPDRPKPISTPLERNSASGVDAESSPAGRARANSNCWPSTPP